MAKQTINLGVIPTGVGGDTPRSANTKINANFDEIYGWGNGGALAKLIGGNIFSGGTQVVQSVDGSAMAIQSTSGQNLMTWGASYNAAADGVGWFSCASGIFNFDRISGGKANIRVSTCQVTQNVESSGQNLVFGTSGDSGGAVYVRPNGSGNTAGQMVAYQSGIVTAVQFTPTSSADVKDYIEGFSGDACRLIDKLVVITHQYRPDFVDSDKVYLSLLAENVKDVLPSATEGGFDVTENVEHEVEVNVEVEDEDGQGTHVEKHVEVHTEQIVRHVPLGVSLMPMIALSVRAHQQKNRRIKQLEETVASLVERLESAGI